MRILILNWRCPKHPLAGGAEKITLEHASYWIKKGIEVVWLSGNYSKGKTEEIIRGVKILRYGTPFTIYFLAPFIYWITFKGNFDLVFDEFHGIPFLSPLWAWKSKKIAYIHEVAQEIWDEMMPFPINILGRIYEKFYFFFYRSIKFITASNSTKNDLVKYGVHKSNITVIPHGLFLKRVSIPPKKEQNLTFIFLGRLVPMKGLEKTIEIFKNIHKYYPSSRLWIVGKGKMEYIKIINNIINNYKISKNVKFFGYVNEKTKIKLLRRAHFLLHTSIREGFGLTVIEANSQGTPILAIKSPGLKNIIHNEYNGYFIKKDSQLCNILSISVKKYKKICLNCVQYSKNYSWDSIQKILYKQIISI